MLPLQSRVPLANNADVVWRVLVLFDVLPVPRADVQVVQVVVCNACP
jgi:hypothetical protein